MTKLLLAAFAGIAIALAGCAGTSNVDKAYAADQAVTAASTTTMALLSAHKITPVQAQKVADLSKAVLAGATAVAHAAPGSTVEAADLTAAIAALQAYVASLGG